MPIKNQKHIDTQRIHMALVKPLGRWQYLLGKWLGIVLLDGLLVALVGGGVFAVAAAVRRLPAADVADRRAVDEEVFTARSVARPEHPRGGDFEADVAAAIAQQEIFGPVLCVMPFESEDEVVSLANSSDYGLAAGIWTEDFSRAWRVARAIDAGTVWINTYKRLSISAPFGGFKDSGLGREKGVCGRRLYQQVKSVYFGL